jgi:hypothetical protein
MQRGHRTALVFLVIAAAVPVAVQQAATLWPWFFPVLLVLVVVRRLVSGPKHLS